MLKYISDVLSNINFLAFMTATLSGIYMFVVILHEWVCNDTENLARIIKDFFDYEVGKWLTVIFTISLLLSIFVPKNLHYLMTGKW